jgi:DegV family protein with EDD domain
VDSLNGRRIFDAFNSGARQVIDHQDHLNRINVFPVPDGDTGTNLAATLSHIMGTTRVTDSVGATILSMSDAAIIGARGNSGAIFAQFLGGLSEALEQSPIVTLELFAHAVRNARDRAYQAISTPREGTILSVISDWSRSLIEHARESRTFHELFDRTLPVVEESLRRTPEQLPILKQSGVVDAGAQGFYHFVRGARDYLCTGKAPSSEDSRVLDLDASHDVPASDESITFRWCTEVMLLLEKKSIEGLRAEIEPLGDSLIVVNAGEKARVHIHTDRPADLVEALRRRGRILAQKAEDMRAQFQTVHHRTHSIALVTDSACDLPREILDEHQIHVVPMRILFGDTEYIDRVTITPEGFARRQRNARPYPSTSQPPSAELHHMFAWLSSHYESVIAVHVSGRMSGTFAASAREAARIPGARITVIDSRHLSGSLGLIVLRAAEAIAAGAGHDEVVRTIESSISKARILVSVKTLDYMVRGGRVSPLQGILGKLVNLKPIVSVDPEGKSLLFGKAFSVRANIEKILAMVAEDHSAHRMRACAVVHAGVPEAARQFAGRLKEITGMDPLYVMEISPVVSLNSGPGALSVVTMQE